MNYLKYFWRDKDLNLNQLITQLIYYFQQKVKQYSSIQLRNKATRTIESSIFGQNEIQIPQNKKDLYFEKRNSNFRFLTIDSRHYKTNPNQVKAWNHSKSMENPYIFCNNQRFSFRRWQGGGKKKMMNIQDNIVRLNDSIINLRRRGRWVGKHHSWVLFTDFRNQECSRTRFSSSSQLMANLKPYRAQILLFKLQFTV